MAGGRAGSLGTRSGRPLGCNPRRKGNCWSGKVLNLLRRIVTLFAFALLSAIDQCAQTTGQSSQLSKSPAYDKAFHLLQTGRADEALAEIDTALAREPSDPSLINLRGLVSAQLGRTEEAEASFRKVIRLLP